MPFLYNHGHVHCYLAIAKCRRKAHSLQSTNMNDLEAAKQVEPSLVIIPLDTTFDLFRLPSADAGRFVHDLESLFSKTLQYSIKHPSGRPSKDDSTPAVSEKSSGQGYVSITRTVNEISILVDTQVGEELRRNEEWVTESQGGIVEYEGPYGCLRVRGPMPLREYTVLNYRGRRDIDPSVDLTGIAANFTKTLQVAGIAVFLISTW